MSAESFPMVSRAGLSLWKRLETRNGGSRELVRKTLVLSNRLHEKQTYYMAINYHYEDKDYPQ